MKRNNFALTALAVALALVQTPALATNGYFLPGAGFRSQGMGGVGIAYGRDSLSIGANPANVTKTGMRGDMGFGIFNPERYAAVGNSTGVLNPDGSPAEATFGFDSASESDSKYFIVPEMGMTMPLTERLSVGMAFVANGGMNTTYPVNLFSYNGFNPAVPGADAKLGVDMMQLLVPLTVGYKVNENHVFGAALQLAVTRFRAYGLEAFGFFDNNLGNPISADPDHMTGQGFDYSYGAGVKLGWQGEFLDDRLTLGLAYTSRTYMTKFDKYRGLFAEQGDFDIPESYGLGIAIKPVKNLIIAADVVRIKYSDIAAIGNGGPTTSPGKVYNFNNQLKGVISIPNPIFEAGNDQGLGFGWKDMTVYKLGVQYGVNNRLQLRAGYNYGKSPIPDNQLTFNILAPAVVERHYSVGFTYKASDELEVTGMYMYAASNSQASPPRQNIVGSATVNMHQNVFGLSLGWVLDPGPGALEEYGAGDWAGINFDGWYGGFGFGQSRYRDVVATSANTRTEGWKVYSGYQFNKYLGVEGGFANLNDFTAQTAATRTNTESDAWTLAAVGAYPLTGKLSVTAKLGAAYVLTKTNTKVGAALTQRSGEDSYVPNYGVGIKYALLDNMDLRAEWERFDLGNNNINKNNIDLMTAGFAVKF
ncbi:MAG: outer membrane beta-barrel protein [Sulfuriferula multivorans]|uniref:Outer membrane beta-barrel protein n=1 Tax=Sulfuriferula multivorans TaxID=1559896 RepID=A0A7C9KXL5_9PROT|nr:outer membrane beta-barrel protein [Sulfuriferula multivorans]